MIQLIKENKFEELKERLKNSDDFQIHKFLLEVLENNKIEIDDKISFFIIFVVFKIKLIVVFL